GGGVTAPSLVGPIAYPLPLLGLLPRPLPRPLAIAPPRGAAPIVGSGAPCLAGVAIVVALVLTKQNMSLCMTFQESLLAAGAGISLVDSVVAASRVSKDPPVAFALIRPPGHHAVPKGAMGFCVLGNIVIAARYAQRMHGLKRVFIIDFDVHHGNGTNDAFYEDPDIFFLSTHQLTEDMTLDKKMLRARIRLEDRGRWLDMTCASFSLPWTQPYKKMWKARIRLEDYSLFFRAEVYWKSPQKAGSYPGTGKIDQIGSGNGEGSTLNLPLPGGSGDTAMRTVFDEVIVPCAQRFKPDIILVSAG
ncbi:hypothetical protein H5410_000862, partial [Solanum commersonii]